jgi:magnesium-protoporphyrin IX monomethyl ester (oxidative) cyclase
MLWKFNKVYNPERQFAEHSRPVKYAMQPPPAIHSDARPESSQLFIHAPRPSGHGAQSTPVPPAGGGR